MFPHPNRLPRWLHRLMLISGALLLLSGLGWEVLRDTLGAGREQVALPHPGEAWLMRLHGLALLGFVLALGALGPVHVPRGWREGRNRRSGLLLIVAAIFLLCSGYALSYWVGDETRRAVGLSHTTVGVMLALLVSWHRRASTRPAS